MSDFSRTVQVRWADLDPNFHVRHSVYYDWGAFCRVEFLNAWGITPPVMQQLQFGPILFREECVFRKEIRLSDVIIINLSLLQARKDFSRWSIRHQILKNDGSPCAILTVDGAWIDVVKRKLASPPSVVADGFENMPKAEEFSWQ
ncbi:MAG: acyl-CoA thioesterase [Flavisolibacter sp.]|jgi:acyl-CoA thioester hydrolase